MKRIFCFISLLILVTISLSQTGIVSSHPEWTKIISKTPNEKGDTLYTYLTITHDYNCTPNRIIVFSIINDTLDGDFFQISAQGILEYWCSYNMGKLWNIYSTNDTLRFLNIIEGEGVILDYGEIINIDVFQNTVTKHPHYRMYMKNGKLNGVVEFYSDYDSLFAFAHIDSNSSKYNIRNRELQYLCKDDSIFNVRDIVYLCINYPNYDTIFYLKNYIVVGYDVLDEVNKTVNLKPDEFYLPKIYYSKKRNKQMKKIKRRLVRIYENANGFSDKYYKKYFEIFK